LKIPQTTPKRYLSGIAALNIPSDDGTGDWHLHNTLKNEKTNPPVFLLVGEGCQYNSNQLFGNLGIFECSDILEKFGVPHPEGEVWAADHYRATADMVLFYAQQGKSFDHLPINDWFNTDHEIMQLKNMLQFASSTPFFEDIKQWINQKFS
jgi:hypothetical protein